MRSDARRSIGLRGFWWTLAQLPDYLYEYVVNRYYYRRYYEELGDDDFDQRWGTDTTGIVDGFQLDVASREGEVPHRYETPSTFEILTVLHTPKLNHRKFVFIDAGSGKGKVLMLASGLPFSRVIGVELSPSLHQIAGQNLTRLPQDRRERVIQHCLDFEEFELPDAPIFLFLFNPFPLSVLKRVMQKIDRFLENSRRPMLIAYLTPEDDAHFAAVAGSEHVRQIETPHRWWQLFAAHYPMLSINRQLPDEVDAAPQVGVIHRAKSADR